MGLACKGTLSDDISLAMVLATWLQRYASIFASIAANDVACSHKGTFTPYGKACHGRFAKTKALVLIGRIN